MSVLIDTGYRGDMSIGTGLFAKLDPDLYTLDPIPAMLFDVLGQVELESRRRIDTLVFAGRRCRYVVVEKSKLHLLGVQFLSRYTVTLDMPGQTAYFEPAPDRLLLTDRSGIALERDKLGTRICAVAEQCPGALAGLQVGDIILKVDGDEVHTKTLAQFRRLLSAPSSHVQFKIRGGDKEHQIELLLQNNAALK